jgi:molecular chaperone GrpE
MRRKTPPEMEPLADNHPAIETPSEEAIEAQAPLEPATAETVPQPEGAEEAENRAQELETLRARVAELEKQVEQEHAQYLRVLADFQNYRRRNEEQRGELQQFANREMILGLLPIVDNFERALAAAEKNQSYEALVGGVALTLRQLQEFLTKQGVEPIEAVGKEFDPNLHEAVMRVEDSEHPENTVVDEVQKGYTMHSRVLRPSMVKVARRK